jgi:type IV pilus assembly protein PilB
MSQFAKKLRTILEKAGKLDGPTGDTLLAEAQSQRRPFTEVLVKKGVATEQELLAHIARAANVPPIDLSKLTVNKEVLESVPEEVAREYCIFPVDRIGSLITIAVANPFDVLKLDDIRIITGCQLRIVVSTAEEIEKIRGKGYQRDTGSVDGILESFDDGDVTLKDEEDLDDSDDLSSIRDEDSPVVKLVNKMILDACNQGASDIHIEPFEKKVIIRYRKDGCLFEAMTLPKRMQNNVTSRIKIMSKLDIAEKRLPQDGRIKIRYQDQGATKDIDFRVSCLPTLFGEKIVLRILDKDKLMLDMTRLGFESESLAKFEAAIQKPWGMVLVTGPTGSGKTNTLYSSISRINTPETNIMTAEDPVEFNLAGVNQVLVREGIGLSFAAALRSFLRQDPNVILVGEIRDFETAEIAVKAALTGHLVLSTLHTNDAPSTVSRLMNMGIEPFLVASSLNLICAQRLVRRICKHCAEPHPTLAPALLQAGFSADDAKTVVPRKGRGCDKCNNTGYKGRVGLYEVLEVTEDVRELILVGASSMDLRRKAIEEGMLTLRASGLRKVKDGVTTVDEVVRETVK